MSIAKGFTFENITEFCDRYNCKLLMAEEDLDVSSKELSILASCGCNCVTTFNKLFKNKKGIYCDECFDKILTIGTNCFKCGKHFMPKKTSFLFCSALCQQSREKTEEIKQKVRISVLKKIDKYVNPDGSIKSNDEISQIRTSTKRKRYEQSQKPRKMSRLTVSYEKIKQTYEDNNCQLVTTEDDYNKMRETTTLKKIPFRIISSCGHESNESLYYSLIEQGTGKLCRKCTDDQTVRTMSSYSKTGELNTSMMKHKEGIDYIISLCSQNFIIQKTRDGCRSAIILKPLECEDDEWLQIKLKTKDDKFVRERDGHVVNGISPTNTRTGFRITRFYDDVITLMIYIDVNKIWIFEPNELKIKTYVMGKTYDNYPENLVTDISKKLKEMYDLKIYNTTLEKANEPISETVKLEYKYVLFRRKTIGFLEFTENDIASAVYNFKINDLKVQEKVFTPQKKCTYVSSLCKNYGRYVKGPYQKGDNDIYWFNVNDHSKDFYVVPEHELIKIDCVASDENKGRCYFNVTKNSEWLDFYKFNYHTINEPLEQLKLMTLISKIKERKIVSI